MSDSRYAPRLDMDCHIQATPEYPRNGSAVRRIIASWDSEKMPSPVYAPWRPVSSNREVKSEA